VKSKEIIISEVVKEIDAEMDSYIAHIYEPYKKVLNSKRAPYQKQLDFLSNFYVLLHFISDKYRNFFNTLPVNALGLFYSKIGSDIISIRQCLFMGQLLSASSIERNIFETYVDTLLILENDTEERIRLYMDYEHVELWLKYEEYKRDLTDLESNPDIAGDQIESARYHFNQLFKKEEIPLLVEAYEKIKDNYHPKTPYHWAWKIFKDKIKGQNPKLNFICKYLGIYDDYQQVYSTASLAVHNSPLMRNFLSDGEGMSSIPIFNETLKSIAGISLNLSIEIINKIFRYINFPDVDRIEFYLNHTYKKVFID
jgi:hypothetical protein